MEFWINLSLSLSMLSLHRDFGGCGEGVLIMLIMWGASNRAILPRRVSLNYDFIKGNSHSA